MCEPQVATQSPHLLPVPTLQVLQLPVLLLPHRLQFSLVRPSQALQLSHQVPQKCSPLLPLLHRAWGRRLETAVALTRLKLWFKTPHSCSLSQ